MTSLFGRAIWPFGTDGDHEYTGAEQMCCQLNYAVVEVIQKATHTGKEDGGHSLRFDLPLQFCIFAAIPL